jgi:hypothetical protein
MSAWEEIPSQRPSFKEIGLTLAKLPGFTTKSSYLDYLMQKMTEYSEQLERRVAEATFVLLNEKKLSDELLAQMMPRYRRLTADYTMT